MPGSRIGYCNLEPLRRFQDQGQRHLSIARIPERVSSNLRCGGRQPNLILIIQSKFRRHFASALPCVNDVSFGEEGDMDDRNRQESRCFRYDDAHIIALPAVIAEQCASDNGGVPARSARICREIPLCLQPIRMQAPSVRIRRPWDRNSCIFGVIIPSVPLCETRLREAPFSSTTPEMLPTPA